MFGVGGGGEGVCGGVGGEGANQRSTLRNRPPDNPTEIQYHIIVRGENRPLLLEEGWGGGGGGRWGGQTLRRQVQADEHSPLGHCTCTRPRSGLLYNRAAARRGDDDDDDDDDRGHC